MAATDLDRRAALALAGLDPHEGEQLVAVLAAAWTASLPAWPGTIPWTDTHDGPAGPCGHVVDARDWCGRAWSEDDAASPTRPTFDGRFEWWAERATGTHIACPGCGGLWRIPEGVEWV